MSLSGARQMSSTHTRYFWPYAAPDTNVLMHIFPRVNSPQIECTPLHNVLMSGKETTLIVICPYCPFTFSDQKSLFYKICQEYQCTLSDQLSTLSDLKVMRNQETYFFVLVLPLASLRQV